MTARDNRFDQQPGGESRTHQSFADDADINTIMGRYRNTGFVENVTLKRAVYGDFTDANSYHDQLNQLNAAQELFDSLPARVRARVNNDPAQLIAFVEDPTNDDELIELGLKNPIEEGKPEPTPPEPTPEPKPTETIADA